MEIISQEKYNALISKYGFKDAEPDTHALFNGYLRKSLKKALATAMLTADEKNNKTVTENEMEPTRKRHRVYIWTQ